MKKTGVPAFTDHYGRDGMTLRDWFAGQALAGLLGSECEGYCYSSNDAARNAYAMADAMLSEREKE